MPKDEWIEKQMRKTLAPLLDDRMAAQWARLPMLARRRLLGHLGIHNADSPAEYIADGTTESREAREPPEQPMRNPECAGCGLTAADLPDEVLEDEVLVETELFSTGDDGQTYCQGCQQMPRGELEII